MKPQTCEPQSRLLQIGQLFWMLIKDRDVYLVIVLMPSPPAGAFDDFKRFTAKPSRQQMSTRSEIGEIAQGKLLF
jgi:hypothetical protein